MTLYTNIFQRVLGANPVEFRAKGLLIESQLEHFELDDHWGRYPLIILEGS